MATPFSGQILWPSPGFTFAASSVAVCNLYLANKNLSISARTSGFVYFSVNGVQSFGAALPNGSSHFGPFVFNGGDTIAFTTGGNLGNLNAYAIEGVPAVVGINGEYYQPFTTKVPFSALVQENSSNYVVPAGKIARFMAYGQDFTLAINGMDIGTETLPGTALTYLYYVPIGPFLADAGSVISVTHCLIDSPQPPGVSFINGWLFNK